MAKREQEIFPDLVTEKIRIAFGDGFSLHLASFFEETGRLRSDGETDLPTQLREIAAVHKILLKETDFGSQELPEEKRCWKRFQIWGQSADTISGSVLGEAEESMEQAWLDVLHRAADRLGTED